MGLDGWKIHINPGLAFLSGFFDAAVNSVLLLLGLQLSC